MKKRLHKITTVLISFAVFGAPLTVSNTANAEIGRGAEKVNFVEITPQTRVVIDKGLAYLAKSQNSDGSFTAPQSPAGITAIAMMAFLANGHTPGRGKYGKNVEKGLEYILSCTHKTGLIAKNVSRGPMYGHGFATLFLGEVYGMTGPKYKFKNQTREALIKAVRLIVASQNKQGGWRYQPVPNDADISVTICQVMALRSARNAGIQVPKKTMENAISYVKKCQTSDGGFAYMVGSGGSMFPRSAAGLASLYYAGIYKGKEVENGLTYMMNQKKNGIISSGGGWFYYGHYYASQAMFQAGGKYWAEWYPAIRDKIIKTQTPAGSFSGVRSSNGAAYSTGMSLIILSTPNRLLPIFQR